MLCTFLASVGCHWERSGPRHPLDGAPRVAAANPQSDRGQQRGDAAVQHGKTRDFTTKLDSFFTFVKTWIITTRIYILVSVSRFSPLFFSTGP